MAKLCPSVLGLVNNFVESIYKKKKTRIKVLPSAYAGQTPNSGHELAIYVL